MSGNEPSILDHTTIGSGEDRTSRAVGGAWIRAVTSLQCKTTVLVTLLTLFVTGAVSGYLLRYSGRLVRSEQEAHLLLAASLFADAVAPALQVGDRDSLQAIADRTANGTPLMLATIVDADRNILVSSRRSPAASPVDTNVLAVSGNGLAGVRVMSSKEGGSPILVASYPVSRRGGRTAGEPEGTPTLLGYVGVGIIADRWERSMASRLDLLVGVGMLATLAAIPLGFLLVRRIVAPVEGLADAMTRFASGSLDVRSSIDRRDEIGRLARAFNKMAEQHRRAHDKLVRLNTELEERVASRTRQLREIASREPLTGLYNRRHFSEVLNRRFAEAQRYDTELSCIMIDLDGFKDANDAFGHHAGDELLVRTAATILSQLRTADVAARYGGDEFVILLPQTDASRAEVLADRIMQKFNRDVGQRLSGKPVTMSMGVGSLRDLDVRDAEALVRAADRAMYRAKSEGKNRVIGPLRMTGTPTH